MQSFALIQAVVRTESGIVLGRVKNVESVWPDLRVARLEVQKFLGPKLLVGVEAIIRLEPGLIIVKDAVVKERLPASVRFADN